MHVGHHVLDFLTVIEPQSRQHPVRNSPEGEFLFKCTGLGVFPIQHRHIAVGISRLVQAIDFTADIPGLLLLVGQSTVGDLRSVLFLRPQSLLLPALIVANDGVGQVQNISVGAVILLQFDGSHLRKILLEIQNIPNVRPSPLVNALIVVPHHTEVPVGLGQQVNQFVLQVVGVLILIHHDVLKPISVIRQNLRIRFQEAHPVENQVIEVHGVIPHHFLLVFPIHLIHGVRSEVSGILRNIFFRILLPLLGIADDADYIADGIGLFVDFQGLHNPLHQGFSVRLIVHRETGLISQHLALISKHPKTHGMEGHDPHSPGPWNQAFHPIPHLSGRLVGKGHRHNLGRVHALLNHVRNSMGHGGGLPASRSGQNQKWPVNMLHCFLLFAVQI